MPASSKAKVHDVFSNNITELATQNLRAVQAAHGLGNRPWNMPTAGWKGHTLDVPAITGAFDRSEITTNFEEVIASGTNPGTTGDVVSLKCQADYIAVMERAFRARHASPVRLLAFAAARRYGHGQAAGVLLGGTLKYAQDAIVAGAT